jgi:hypothetical protein
MWHIRADGSLSTIGWPSSPPVEAEVAAIEAMTTKVCFWGKAELSFRRASSWKWQTASPADRYEDFDGVVGAAAYVGAELDL